VFSTLLKGSEERPTATRHIHTKPHKNIATTTALLFQLAYSFFYPSIIPWLFPVGVHCIVDCPSPEITILCPPAESMNVFLVPLIDVVQPFSVWSASSRCSFHYAKYNVFHQSGVFHSTDMTEQVQFSFQDDSYDVLRSSYS